MHHFDGIPRDRTQGTIAVDVLVQKYFHPPSSQRVCYARGLEEMEKQVKDAEIIIQAHDRSLSPSLPVVISVVSNNFNCGCEAKQLKSETVTKHLRKARQRQKPRQRLRTKTPKPSPLVCLLR